MFGISGYARTGKDTFGETLVTVLQRYGIKAKTYALATQLKFDIDFLTTNDFGISAFTKDDKEKKIIRPILVGYGEAWRIADPEHWISVVDSNLEPRTLPIITDIRYENEADYILANQGFLLNLSRIKEDGFAVEAPNKEEELNAPLVAKKASFLYSWATTDNKEEIEQLVESFTISILQQDGLIDLWKAIYPL
jgi:hypothetical protein